MLKKIWEWIKDIPDDDDDDFVASPKQDKEAKKDTASSKNRQFIIWGIIICVCILAIPFLFDQIIALVKGCDNSGCMMFIKMSPISQKLEWLFEAL